MIPERKLRLKNSDEARMYVDTPKIYLDGKAKRRERRKLNRR